MEDLYVVTVVIPGYVTDEFTITVGECLNLKSRLDNAQSGMVTVTTKEGVIRSYSVCNISKLIIQPKTKGGC